jgi:hypothetical protein
MKNFTFFIAFLMIFSVMAKGQNVASDLEHLKLSPTNEFIDLDFVWCDFEGEYTNVDGFRETINSNTVASDVSGFGVDGSTAIELIYNVTAEIPTTGYQMWSYPDMIYVSDYEYLAFNVKADMIIDSAYVILLDNVSVAPEGNSQHSFSIDTEWQQVLLPLDSFTVQTGWENPADLTILHLIQVLFINDVVSENAATVYIDDVGFITDAVSVPDVEFDEMAVYVYPNPATNYVNVNAEPGSQINIINIRGSIIASKIADGATTRFSLSGLPQGIYLVRVINNTTSITTKVIAR